MNINVSFFFEILFRYLILNQQLFVQNTEDDAPTQQQHSQSHDPDRSPAQVGLLKDRFTFFFNLS